LITSVLHRAAGLTISADRPLPGFTPVAGEPREDLRIHLETRPPWHETPFLTRYAANSVDSTGRPTVTVSRSRDGFHFRYADGTHAWISGAGTDVWCTWPDAASLADTCTYLCGPILGLVLRLRGALSFHASAVQPGAGAIAFVGPHDAGKSTLAAALAAAGCAVVTDDVLHVRLDGVRWVAEPFTSMLKLWPEGARLALGDSVDLPVITEGWDKRALAMGPRIRPAAGPLPLNAIACLAPRETDPVIDPITPGTALIRLAANSSASHLLEPDGRAAEFIALSALVRSVPCVSLTPPLDPAGFPAFVARVLAWARRRDCDAPQ
jgi:hypothetical protein